jgi:hypothetical protein
MPTPEPQIKTAGLRAYIDGLVAGFLQSLDED